MHCNLEWLNLSFL